MGAVRLGLDVEDLGAGDGNDPSAHAFRHQVACGPEHQSHLRPGRHEDDFRLAVAVQQNVSPPGDQADLIVGSRHVGESLASQNQTGGTIEPLHRRPPRNRGFHRIAGSPHRHVGHGAQAAEVLDGLMGRSVLAQADGVVGEDQDAPDPHQRRHAQRVAGVVGEHQEGAAVGNEAAVQRQAVQDRSHGKFAYAEIEVVTGRLFGVEDCRAAVQGVIGACQVRRSADQFGQVRRERLQRPQRRLSRGHVTGFSGNFPDRGIGEIAPVPGKPALHSALELLRQVGPLLGVGIEALLPLRLQRLASGPGIPRVAQFIRHDERLVLPADLRSSRRDLVRPQRRPVGIRRALLVGGAPADKRLAADQRRTIRLRARRFEGRNHGVGIVSVHILHNVPAVGAKPCRRIVREPSLRRAVDGDGVVVVDADQFSQAQCASQRTGLVGDALHQATVAHEDIGEMVDDRPAGPVEGCRQRLLCQRHAHRIGQPLPQRAGGGLDGDVHLPLRVTGGPLADLAELPNLIHLQGVPAEVRQRVNQHGAVPVGKHEPVAVAPVRIRGIVP